MKIETAIEAIPETRTLLAATPYCVSKKVRIFSIGEVYPRDNLIVQMFAQENSAMVTVGTAEVEVEESSGLVRVLPPGNTWPVTVEPTKGSQTAKGWFLFTLLTDVGAS